MSETEKKPEPYDLAPEPPLSPGSSPPPQASAAPRVKLDKPALLEGFEDDADFTKDPEVEAVLKGKPVGAAAPAVTPEDPGSIFVIPGLGDERVWGLVGAALLLATLIAVGINTGAGTTRTVASVALMLYKVLIHTGTGVVAVWIAAVLSEKRFGRLELGAARMFAAVAAMALFFSVRIAFFGTSDFERNLWSTLFGAAAYLGLVAGLFRIWGRPLMYVVGSHLGLWLLVQVGLLLAAYVSAVPAPPAAGAP